MQLGADGDGSLLQRALDGQPVDDAAIAALVAVAREIEAIDQVGLAPRPDFVAELRQRLLDEPAASGPSPSDARPAIVRIGRRPRRLLAAAAVLIVLAGGLGFLSRSALPGDGLYPVKQLLDRVALALQRDPLEVGLTHLAQARQHVGEADLLAAQPAEEQQPQVDPAARAALDANLTTALEAATDSSLRGHDVLLQTYREQQRPDALTSLSDFYAEILPAVDGLATYPLPPRAEMARQRLQGVLEQGRDETLRTLAACSICGEAAARAAAVLAGTTPTASAATQPSPTASTTSSGTGSTTSSSPEPSPGSTSSGRADGGSGDTSPGGSVRLPSVGVGSTSLSAGGGGVTLPAPLPTVTLPSVGLDSSGATVGGGGATLPGATVSLPTVTIPLPDSTP